MARIAVRRAAARSTPSAAGTILLGLGLGVAVGFLLGELGGPTATRALKRRGRKASVPRSAAELVREAQSALDDDVLLHDCGLRVLAAGAGRIELHGWVPDRRSRARAAHLVGDAVTADAIINCLQVHGEDDQLLPVDDAHDERAG
ncbi:MAG: hypothetical protein ABUL71_04700 [Gemmatimonadota bacterium]